MIQLKRVYEPPSQADGVRILVERLWPRGLTKQQAKVDLWIKEVAPSPALRKWFSHDPAKWKLFSTRYEAELDQKGDLITLLRQKMQEGSVTLIFAARDEQHNSAVVLKQVLTRHTR